MEKTKITEVREGFDFLGYRIAQKRMPSTGRHVGMLFIPKGKSQLLRDKIKAKVRETPTGRTLADLIDDLNPVITGWRNYYRYATRSWKEFAKHDWWLYWRLKSWLGKAVFAVLARCGIVSFRGLLRRSSSCSNQSRQLDEIVGGHRPNELEVKLLDAAQHGSRQPTDRLAPAERLLDPLAPLLACFVAVMARRAAIDGGAAAGRVLGNMRGNVLPRQDWPFDW